MSDEKLSILCLPDVCLENVLKFVDIGDRLNASLVCQRFYEAICELEKDKNQIEITYDQICNDEIFRSITASKRKVRNLTLDLTGYQAVSSLSRIEIVVKTFGDRIKQFKIWKSIQSEWTKLTDNHLIALLKLIPRVEELFLQNFIFTTSAESRLSFHETDLRKLKKLSIYNCCFDSSFVLDSIPQDILTELDFTFDSSVAIHFQNFFNRQSNIKKLEIFENDNINFDHLQLEHLKMRSSDNFISVINNQPNLRLLSFGHSFVDDDGFSAVCQLKHLEVLRTRVDNVSAEAIKSLRKLSKLKEFRMECRELHEYNHLFRFELSLIKCLHQLEKITLFRLAPISDAIIIEMGRNLKSLQSIEIIYPSLRVVGIVLENFPLLQSIILEVMNFEVSEDIISDDFTHESLKQLVITKEIGNTKYLLKLANACPNLERIMLSTLKNFLSSDLNEILHNHQKLSHLSLDFLDEFKIDEEIILAIKISGHKLDYLCLDGREINVPDFDIMKAIFEIDFPIINCSTHDSRKLIMKKRGIADWDPSL